MNSLQICLIYCIFINLYSVALGPRGYVEQVDTPDAKHGARKNHSAVVLSQTAELGKSELAFVQMSLSVTRLIHPPDLPAAVA